MNKADHRKDSNGNCTHCKVPWPCPALIDDLGRRHNMCI